MKKYTEQPSTLRQVLSLQDQSTSDLKALWQQLFHESAPRYRKEYLVTRLAYRLQELAYGPIEEKTKKKLDDLVSKLKKGKAISKNRPQNKPTVGTKLIRVYQGASHEVMVDKDGFIYQGQLYKSLSVIARKITGTRWNGPLFFGLRKQAK